ncbi:MULTISPECIES: type II toxin-antitoxin system antitoxin HipB [Enterobacter]|jgi:HTH-type transcriptional regulator/antitoxin HipB|uniref:type II toxin-antitoxin system antitoxin HipB n=2 Tax=Enterobacter TaxID=547 RepID=UPI0015E9718B|nr:MULTISPECIES: type II toxin-antitoxin system antitoxin HipB [Enterobacter]HDR2751831.1 type II toxin-antitoxin system antitoxin HipB [Enterobacter asburiae]QMR78349.1 type II toxin-antitoxin system antitoxin HipB [Enterobacter sp. RHBSTW-00175]WNT38686.1 type II toxin-antitoxin system antitoxin HipB [Enterobacter cloacae]HDR2789946.1 type II toxin-antitoxin system antitoxin HipB [Enterobacter asburiae]HDR2795515.1 type II toxin-antitoxin system antitoxin HipB [Enterobacter asburiae]
MKPPMIYSPVQLANTMKLVRQKNNWTQSDLAKRIGIKQATISNFENNPDNTTLTTFFRILQSLGMTMALYEKDDAASGSDNNSQQGLDW